MLRIAETSRQTAAHLRVVADMLREAGLVGWAKVTLIFAVDHEKIATDYGEDTLPRGIPDQ